MTKVTEEQFNSIIEYVRKEIKQWDGIYMDDEGQNDLSKICKYQDYIDQLPKRKKKVVVEDEYTEDWNRFWQMWPSTDHFIYKGKEFSQTRVLKKNEVECRKLYVEARKKGYTSNQMERSIEVLMVTKKEQSYKTGKNELTYTNALEPWLRSGSYIHWVHTPIPIVEKQVIEYSNSTDV